MYKRIEKSMETPRGGSYGIEDNLSSHGPLMLGDLASPTPTITPGTYQAASTTANFSSGTLRVDTPLVYTAKRTLLHDSTENGRSPGVSNDNSSTISGRVWKNSTKSKDAAEDETHQTSIGKDKAKNGEERGKKKKKKKKKSRTEEAEVEHKLSNSPSRNPENASIDLVRVAQEILSLTAIPMPELPDVSSDESSDNDDDKSLSKDCNDSSHEVATPHPLAECRIFDQRPSSSAIGPQEAGVIARIWDNNDDSERTRSYIRPTRRGMPGLTIRPLSTVPHAGGTDAYGAGPNKTAIPTENDAPRISSAGVLTDLHRITFRDRKRYPPYKLVMHLQALLSAIHEKPVGEVHRCDAVTQTDLEESTWKLHRNNSIRLNSLGFANAEDVHESILHEQEEIMNITQWSREAEASAVSRVEVHKMKLIAAEERLARKKKAYDEFRTEKMNELCRIAAELQERNNVVNSDARNLELRKANIRQLRVELQEKYGPDSAVSGGFVPSVEDLKLLTGAHEKASFVTSQGTNSNIHGNDEEKLGESPRGLKPWISGQAGGGGSVTSPGRRSPKKNPVFYRPKDASEKPSTPRVAGDISSSSADTLVAAPSGIFNAMLTQEVDRQREKIAKEFDQEKANFTLGAPPIPAKPASYIQKQKEQKKHPFLKRKSAPSPLILAQRGNQDQARHFATVDIMSFIPEKVADFDELSSSSIKDDTSYTIDESSHNNIKREIIKFNAQREERSNAVESEEMKSNIALQSTLSAMEDVPGALKQTQASISIPADTSRAIGNQQAEGRQLSFRMEF